MENLNDLLTILTRSGADELQVSPGQPPKLTMGGHTRTVPQAALSEQVIRAAAGDLLSKRELDELPRQRPRIVRHEHAGTRYVIEIAKGNNGISLTLRVAPREEAGPKPRLSRKMKVASQPPKVADTGGTERQANPPPTAPTFGSPPRAAQAPHAPPAHTHPAAAQPQPGPPGHPQPAPASPIQPTATNPKHQSTPEGSSPSPPPMDARPQGAAVGGEARRQPIDDLLRAMLQARASDLHLAAGNHPILRIDGEIHFMKDYPVLRSMDIDALMRPIMNEKVSQTFSELRDADFAYEIRGLSRFRVNLFEDRNGVGSVLRQIPIEILSAEKLGLPRACLDLCNLTKGLVVVTGPTGSGKSTTLAAMIDHINKTRSEHIITIEDPVEFVHPNAKCLVNQREVGQHTKSFKNALRAALREDPDIVLVGEMRDLETIAIAIETAETGHLVFGTLHTTTAISTVDRIIDQFPTDRQSQVRVMLSESLKGVVAQTLCKKLGGGRVAAHEILLGTTAVSSMIREAKTFQMSSIMQTSKALGMCTLNDSLMALVTRNMVDPREAWMKAVDKTSLVAMMKNANIPTPFLA